MPDSPNKLSQFWQELKRRNVTRVLTVYIAVGFMIFESVDILSEPFGLPDWSLKLAFFILIAGLFITIIISWIFDVTPEGVEKTKPTSELKEGEKTVFSNSWRIATYVSIAVIIGLILLNIFSLSKVSKSLNQYGKSIAVLPFINDTQDKENDQFISGTMESIRSNLSKIEDLRVVSRNSVEQYRDTIIPIPEVAEEQRVSYVLGGSMQQYGTHISITLWLVDQNDRHLWSKQFEREIKQAEEFFSFWSEIAQMVAEELEVVITPEEKQLIENIPTASLTAHDYYQRGEDLAVEYHLEKEKDTTKLKTAEYLYYQALAYDSTYAPVYVGLAWVVFRSYWKFNSRQIQQDSVLSLANKALSYDDQLSDAYNIRGAYYAWMTREKEKAIKEFDLALKFNPNAWAPLLNKAMVLSTRDIAASINLVHQAIWRNHGLEEIETVLDNLIIMYMNAGFHKKAMYYSEEKLKLNRDSAQFNHYMMWSEGFQSNWDKVVEIGNGILATDSADMDALGEVGVAYLFLEEYEKSLKYFERLIDRMNATGKKLYDYYEWIGYAYWKNGIQELADFYMNQKLEILNRQFENQGRYNVYKRAAIFAFRGMKEEALADLSEYDNVKHIHQDQLLMIKSSPLFDNIREDPEYQQIVRDIEAKYQAGHESVRKWLEENDML